MQTATNPPTDSCSAQARSPGSICTKALGLRVLGVVAGLLLFTSVAAAQQTFGLVSLPVMRVSPGAIAQLSGSQAQPKQKSQGNIRGSLTAEGGSPVAGAQVALTRGFHSPELHATSDNSGTFSFANVPPGPFELIITAEPFATKTYSGVLKAGQDLLVPLIALSLQTVTTTVVVSPPEVIAERQVKTELHQRVLGFVPNFYVTYSSDPVPLDFKQKVHLAWKSVTNPMTVLALGGAAGVAQARDWYSSYGQGAQGYGKRFGANYGTAAIGTFLDDVFLPTVFRQDPRYIYKGTGSWGSRLFYALSRSVMEKGNNGHWEPNYSGFLGSLATAGISESYYPSADRTAGYAFKVAGVRLAEVAVANVFEEFFSRKLTPSLLGHHSSEQALRAGKRYTRRSSEKEQSAAASRSSKETGKGIRAKALASPGSD